MTKIEGKSASTSVKDILLSNPGGLPDVVRAVMQEVLEAEMGQTLGASKGERTPERLGYRSGHYGRPAAHQVKTAARQPRRCRDQTVRGPPEVRASSSASGCGAAAVARVKRQPWSGT